MARRQLVVLAAGLALLVGSACAGGDEADAGVAEGTGGGTGAETGAETSGGTMGTTGEPETGTDTEGTDTAGTSTTGEPGPQGIFVAVGDGGRRASSPDGLDWAELIGTGTIDTGAEEGEADILRAVAAGDGVVIAVGGGGKDWSGNAMIMRSVDGVNWDEDLLAQNPDIAGRKLNAVAYADGVFIAGGHQSHILRSDDGGLVWTRPYPENHGEATVYGAAGSGSNFVLVGLRKDGYDAPELTYVQRSTDGGLSFEAPLYSGADGELLRSVATNGDVFVATGPAVCLRSPDAGASWEPCGIDSVGYGAVHFTNQRFVVTYLDGLSTSADGVEWSPHVESPTGVPTKVVFGNGVYAGVRYYDRGTSAALDVWDFSTHGGFPLRDLAFLALE